jgi:hypothetical protein
MQMSTTHHLSKQASKQYMHAHHPPNQQPKRGGSCLITSSDVAYVGKLTTTTQHLAVETNQLLEPVK